MPSSFPRSDPNPAESRLPASPRDLARTIEVWFAKAARDLPWRRQRTPWRSLVSELMLQQTQVSRVAERFEGFMTRFPSPRAMVEAGEDAVLGRWEGLGYYRRARLLHAAAVRIIERHEGEVPSEAEALLDLPGVGRYTAGSVASIAFGRREPIVDGNVVRVVARLAAVDARADDPGLVATAWGSAAALVEASEHPGRLNEGLMELGATVCTPVNPDCAACPCHQHCQARAKGLADVLPRPKVRPTRRILHLDLVLLRSAGRLAFVQRPRGGLWGGLWQPPGIESEHTPEDVDRRRLLAKLGVDVRQREIQERASLRRLLTHREVQIRLFVLSGEVESDGETMIWHDQVGAADIGMPKPVRSLIDAHGW